MRTAQICRRGIAPGGKFLSHARIGDKVLDQKQRGKEALYCFHRFWNRRRFAFPSISFPVHKLQQIMVFVKAIVEKCTKLHYMGGPPYHDSNSDPHARPGAWHIPADGGISPAFSPVPPGRREHEAEWEMA
jgi:hypothetical protein